MPPTSPPSGGVRPIRVLFVDDDLDTREAVRITLELDGFTVATAANGIEALALFDALPFDVVATDIFMPEEDGLELIQDLQRRRPGLPIVACSGGGSLHDPSALQAAAAFGASAVLRKPFSGDDLATAIRRVLEAAG